MARTVSTVALDKSNYMGASYSYLMSRRGAFRAAQWTEANGIKQGLDMLYAFQIPMRVMETVPHIVFSQREDSNIQRSEDSFDIPSISVAQIAAKFSKVTNKKCTSQVQYTVPYGLTMILTRAHLDPRCVAFSSAGEIFYACEPDDMVDQTGQDMFVRIE